MELFSASRHPFILTPGDNDWTDCHYVKDRVVDPIERLATVRKLFFSGAESLGQRRIPLTVQASDPRYAKFVENRLWAHGGVLFVTVHVVGSNNNRGRTPEMDAEYAERNAANLAWLAQAFQRGRQEQARAVVIFTQANPQFETTWSATQVRRYLSGLPVNIPEPRRPTGFDDFLAALERDVLAFPKASAADPRRYPRLPSRQTDGPCGRQAVDRALYPGRDVRLPRCPLGAGHRGSHPAGSLHIPTRDGHRSVGDDFLRAQYRRLAIRMAAQHHASAARGARVARSPADERARYPYKGR
jgi:hypothetical protein